MLTSLKLNDKTCLIFIHKNQVINLKQIKNYINNYNMVKIFLSLDPKSLIQYFYNIKFITNPKFQISN